MSEPEAYAQLAKRLKLTPSSATILSVVARHPHKEHPRVVELLSQLDGKALETAQVLVGEGTTASEDAKMLARVFEKWSKATTASLDSKPGALQSRVPDSDAP